MKKKMNSINFTNCTHLLLVVKLLSTIIDDSHDIWIIVLVVIIKRVKEDAQTNPLI
jgi:hypothetical protein